MKGGRATYQRAGLIALAVAVLAFAVSAATRWRSREGFQETKTPLIGTGSVRTINPIGKFTDSQISIVPIADATTKSIMKQGAFIKIKDSQTIQFMFKLTDDTVIWAVLNTSLFTTGVQEIEVVNDKFTFVINPSNSSATVYTSTTAGINSTTNSDILNDQTLKTKFATPTSSNSIIQSFPIKMIDTSAFGRNSSINGLIVLFPNFFDIDAVKKLPVPTEGYFKTEDEKTTTITYLETGVYTAPALSKDAVKEILNGGDWLGKGILRTYKEPVFLQPSDLFRIEPDSAEDKVAVFKTAVAFNDKTKDGKDCIRVLNPISVTSTKKYVIEIELSREIFVDPVQEIEFYTTVGVLYVFRPNDYSVTLYTQKISADPASYKRITRNSDILNDPALKDTYIAADEKSATITRLAIAGFTRAPGIPDVVQYAKYFGDKEAVKQRPVPSIYWRTEEEKTEAIKFINEAWFVGVTKSYWYNLTSLITGIWKNRALFAVVLILIFVIFALISIIKIKISREEAGPVVTGGGRKNIGRK